MYFSKWNSNVKRIAKRNETFKLIVEEKQKLKRVKKELDSKSVSSEVLMVDIPLDDSLDYEEEEEEGEIGEDFTVVPKILCLNKSLDCLFWRNWLAKYNIPTEKIPLF